MSLSTALLGALPSILCSGCVVVAAVIALAKVRNKEVPHGLGDH